MPGRHHLNVRVNGPVAGMYMKDAESTVLNVERLLLGSVGSSYWIH